MVYKILENDKGKKQQTAIIKLHNKKKIVFNREAAKLINLTADKNLFIQIDNDLKQLKIEVCEKTKDKSFPVSTDKKTQSYFTVNANKFLREANIKEPEKGCPLVFAHNLIKSMLSTPAHLILNYKDFPIKG